MPEIKNFDVSQTREVKVRANSLEDAIRIAGMAFTNGQNSDYGVKDPGEDMKGVWGNTTSRVEETDIVAHRSY